MNKIDKSLAILTKKRKQKALISELEMKKVRQEDCYKFESSLGYIKSSRTTLSTEQDKQANKQQPKKKKKK